MNETQFEKQIFDKLLNLEKGMNSMKQELNLIKQRVVDDSILSEEDKKDIESALKEEKEGKLLSKNQVFC